MADFGLSETIEANKEYFRQDQNTVIKLPVKWMAIESISDAVFSEKSDVVSSSLISCFKLCDTSRLCVLVNTWFS